jgi:membrane-bound metal-dependent hydrolase YbcI (DUF457 family)
LHCWRPQSLSLIPLLVGLVLGLDLLWALVSGPTDTLAFGLVDEPAHVATCAAALAALSSVLKRRPAAGFFIAALVASVAIDLDHLPQYLGWGGLTAGTSRPYGHSAVVVAAVLSAVLVSRPRWRPMLLGVAFGICAHLFRDVATGPGVPLGLPFSTSSMRVPYALYAGGLAGLAGIATIGVVVSSMRPTRPSRLGQRALATTRAGCIVLTVVAIGTAVATLTLSANAGASPTRQSRPVGHKKNHSHTGRSARVAMGIYVPNADHNPAELDEYANAVGRQPAIIQLYHDWSEPTFDASSLAAIAGREAIPLITWEPWDGWKLGVSLWDIANGSYDGYIAESARQAAAWGGPIFLRFAHEMNGNWYPWGAGNGANTPVAYKMAWKHVVEIFRREGATNVRWVWTPYVDGGHLPFRRFYPGDKWVDWVGLDGFNWGRPFMSFAKIFDTSYRTMVRMTSKPLMIAETGSAEGAGVSKARWIRRALRRALPRLSHIRALVWWSGQHPDGTDLRIDTSPSALAALGYALQAPRYRPGSKFLLALPYWLKGR